MRNSLATLAPVGTCGVSIDDALGRDPAVQMIDRGQFRPTGDGRTRRDSFSNSVRVGR